MSTRERPAKQAGCLTSTVPCLILLALAASPAGASDDRPFRKKLIETGWDMPTPRQLRENLAEMEKRPFDGVVISLAPSLSSAFENRTWDREDFRVPVEDLKACRFKRFTDNFIMLNANPGNVDWFDDAGWKNVVEHWRIASWAAREAGVKGILFDPEAYVEPYAQFRYLAQPGREQHTFTEYGAKARQRGQEVMRAVAGEYPDATIFSYFLLSIAAPSARHDDPRRALATEGYGLLPAFLDGWLDAAPPTLTFVDGDERGYRYNDPKDYLEAAVQIRGEFQQVISRENRAKYRAQVQVSSGLYLDAYVNPPSSPWYIDGKGGSRVRRLAENLASALRAADEYVWIYGEKGRWWPGGNGQYKPWPEVLPGCDTVLDNARDPVGAARVQIEQMRAQGKLQDLVSNGDFRAGPADSAAIGPPDRWGSWQAESSHGRFGWDARTGEGSATLAGVRDGCLIQSFAAQRAQRYFVTARVRAQGSTEPRVRVRWQTDEDKWTAEQRDEIFYRSTPPGSGWSEIAGVATVPESAGKLVLLLGAAGQGAANETVWFDDVCLYHLP